MPVRNSNTHWSVRYIRNHEQRIHSLEQTEAEEILASLVRQVIAEGVSSAEVEREILPNPALICDDPDRRCDLSEAQ